MAHVQGRAATIFQIRTFRNNDPPSLVDIWNSANLGRGAAHLQGTMTLEHFVLSKLYFDPNGLFIAELDGDAVGFCHAGFTIEDPSRFRNPLEGRICALIVRPEHRCKGIGNALLQRAESYLIESGVENIVFGSWAGDGPFYSGLYGGIESVGVMSSDEHAIPFLVANHYSSARVNDILLFNLDKSKAVIDRRFSQLRRHFDVRVAPRPPAGSWYLESILSPLEILSYELVDRESADVAASAFVCEMDAYSWRIHASGVGIIGLTVSPRNQRQGLGKYLAAHMLRDLQEQCYGYVEAYSSSENIAAQGLLSSLGFQKIDEGHVYEKIVNR